MPEKEVRSELIKIASQLILVYLIKRLKKFSLKGKICILNLIY